MVFRHYHDQFHTLEQYREILQKTAPHLWSTEFFEERYPVGCSKPMNTVKPVVRYQAENNAVRPGFDIPARSNGVDSPQWPADLMVEVVR
jgi:hypothetical protein